MKSHAETEKEKEDAFMLKLRNCTAHSITQDLKYLSQRLRGEKAAGIAGQSQIKLKANKMFNEKKRQQEAFDKEAANEMTDDEFRRHFGKSRNIAKEEEDK